MPVSSPYLALFQLPTTSTPQSALAISESAVYIMQMAVTRSGVR